jgi:hypothetical protein
MSIKTLTDDVLLEMHANVSVGSAQIKSASELNRELINICEAETLSRNTQQFFFRNQDKYYAKQERKVYDYAILL